MKRNSVNINPCSQSILLYCGEIQDIQWENVKGDLIWFFRNWVHCEKWRYIQFYKPLHYSCLYSLQAFLGGDYAFWSRLFHWCSVGDVPSVRSVRLYESCTCPVLINACIYSYPFFLHAVVHPHGRFSFFGRKWPKLEVSRNFYITQWCLWCVSCIQSSCGML